MGLGDPVGGFSQTYMNWFNSMPKTPPVAAGPVGELGAPVDGFSDAYKAFRDGGLTTTPVNNAPVGQLGAAVDGFSDTYKAFRDSGGGQAQGSSLAPDDLQLGTAVGGFSAGYEKWLSSMPETPPPPVGPINGLGDPIGGFSQKYIDFRDGKS